MHISKVHFITNYQSKISHLEQVKQAINGGIEWIQYRPKTSTIENILVEGKLIADLCKQNNVIFIVNDMVDVAVKLNADGVHLGKNDLSPIKAREILGEDKIIGGTANIIEDIIRLIKQGVNYIGLGPFSFTKTKKNLSPILGISGYKRIVDIMKVRNINIPIIAIGGIRLLDINTILNNNIYGIAISSVISEAENISIKAKELINLID